MLKKAMIMAAGVGSRLEPLSTNVPKPLVPLANIPTMDIIVKHLSFFGINDIIANTYYKADQIEKYFNDFCQNINFVRESELSGTAGGMKKCEAFFDEGEDFIVLSGDGLTDIDINEAYSSHKKSGSIATIVTKEVENSEIPKYGIIVTNEQGFVQSFQEKPSIQEAKSNLANTGIYIFNYEIFKFIPQNTFFDFAKNVFPLIMKNNIKINTYNLKTYWSDIGSLEQYKQSNFDILNNKIKSLSPNILKSENNGKYICGENLEIDNTSILSGNNIIGNNCKIGRNCYINNSIIWNNVTIEDNVSIENAIILNNMIISQSVQNEIISEQKQSKVLV